MKLYDATSTYIKLLGCLFFAKNNGYFEKIPRNIACINLNEIYDYTAFSFHFRSIDPIISYYCKINLFVYSIDESDTTEVYSKNIAI